MSDLATSANHSSDFGIEHIDGLYGYAVVLTRNRAQADDLVQETFAHALGAVERLREDSNVKGWLFTILRNLWISELRRRRSSPVFVELDCDTSSAYTLSENAMDAYQIFAANENSAAIQTAIEDLPAQFREIIVLREFQDLSYQEIAAVLGCPAGTVMSRLGRARARLRQSLAATQDATLPKSGTPS